MDCTLWREFIAISHYAGMREDLVQAGGGNSSVKLDDKSMLIKSSGYQLTELTESKGYSTIDYPFVRDALLNSKDSDLLTEEDGKDILKNALLDGERPSIETFLHAITDAVTLHTHPMVVNILTARKNGMETLKTLFPEAVMVGYETPGIRLAQKCFDELRKKGRKTKDIIFLKNHGMIITGKTAEEVIGKNEEVLKTIEDFLDLDMSAQHNSTILWNAFLASGQNGIVWRVTDINIDKAYRQFQGGWAFGICPDCLVYCGKRMLRIADTEDLVKAIQRHCSEYGPVTVAEWRDSLYIFALNVEKAMEIQSVLSFSAQVMLHNMNYECDFLTEEEQNYLLCWDAEKYRKAIQR